ncbi:hypothetical protein [Celeribacter neptunius]|uniref:Hemolysin-type calcium-binding repeat-containing protein n=1 Tax=Celeribacter neptunius TaxID=588602 RepID=A0A1I3K236_9RHOB|nr:hypothetical protein [Celeribacter neptunius]SFI66577.1 hypothetical protein SAMN04487991_0548 [Celeribacter neptunius]
MTLYVDLTSFAPSNFIYGTASGDKIFGTDGDDYIVAGAGKDFWVAGGAGADMFEVNYGDQVVRIADFVVGEDHIALADISVLDGATFEQDGDRFDITLRDSTLIRVDGVTAADIGELFAFRSDVVGGDATPEAGTFDPLDTTALNVITGTEDRDKIIGTCDDDYIIAGQGQDFWVTGGAGRDTFEVNYGDDIVRIADFVTGDDHIALADSTVLDGATFEQDGDRFDITLDDGTLIRVDGATETDLADMFVFRSDAPAPTDPTPTDPTPTDPTPTDPAPTDPAPGDAAPELKVVVFGGQSLAFGATGRDWVTTEPVYDNSLMLDFDDPANGARGWDAEAVDVDTFNGFTQRYEVAQETPATGTMNVLAAANPDTTFVSLHYGQAGKSLDYIRENTLDGLYTQLELLKAQADAEGYAINNVIELAWIQGQSGSLGDYSDTLSAHQDEVEAFVKDLFGAEFEVEFYASITRGFGGKVTTGEQFDAIMDDPEIHLGTTEVVFNSQYPAQGDPWNAHLSGEGYYMMGAQIASHIMANMAGDPLAPIAVEAVEEVAPSTYRIHFSGVQGGLMENPGVYADDDFIGAPDNFGIDVYRANNGQLEGDIIESRIVDADTIEFVFSEDLSGDYRLWVGRSESDGWMVDGRGAGYGGTTLYDSGQIYSAVDPGNGFDLQTAELAEFVPQQYFDFTV